MSRYESHNLEDLSLPFIFQTSSTRPANYRPGSSNWHENLELLQITQGEGLVSLNGQAIEVKAGDCVIIGANHLHAVAAGNTRMYYRYLIVDRSFCLANGFDTNRIGFEPKVEDEALARMWDSLEALYREPEDKGYRVLAIRTQVLQMLLSLCRNHSHPLAPKEHYDRGAAYTKKAIDYLRASYDKDPSLEEVAAFVGISKYYLSREFHRYTGYSFVAYLNRTRCQRARQLLEDESLRIGEVGRLCGFENASYFARAFRRYMGVGPAEYRLQHKK